jgi:hypothetical protein
MRFEMKKPCSDCPFRKDVTPYLEYKRVIEIVNALTIENKTFACHKTVNQDKREQINEQHCAGALIIMEKNKIAYNNNMIRIAERLRIYNYKILDLEAPVYKNFNDMKKAYK